jgi:signal transduction histidine kinase
MDVQPDKKIRYALLSVIKEGLSNIARHSNATAAQLTLIEHPAFYQMVLKDNGTGKKTGEVVISESEGMGLSGIKKRVDGLGGHFTAQKNPGFEIFITVPKEKL